MKKYIISICLVALSSLGMAQTNIVHFSNIEEEPYYLAYGLLANQKHEAALEEAKKALKKLPQGTPHADSLLAETHFIIGACNGSLLKTDKAVKEFNTAAELFVKIYGASNDHEAKMYTHSAHFLNAAKRYKEANEYITKATSIFLKTLPNNKDMEQAVMLAAEINYQLGNYQDAVDFQRIALQLIEQLYGRHHQEYLEECGYMVTYLQGAGQNEDAAKLTAEAAKLLQETKTGYIPRETKFTSPEQCRLYNEDAFYASLYYLSHPLSADSMIFVAKYVSEFAEVTDDVMIIGGLPEESWMNECGKSLPLLSAAYSAASIYVQLQTNEEVPSMKTYILINYLLSSFYETNSQVLDKSKTLDTYVMLKNKSEEKFSKMMGTHYQQTMKGLSSPISIAKGEESGIIPEHPIVDAIFGEQ